MDPKDIVAQGYDRIAERYRDEVSHTRTDERRQYIALLLQQLPAGASVLELGCGTGIPTTQALAQRFAVTGVDISTRHIKLARQQIPVATFLLADMTTLAFPPASFDAVTAFYSIIHVPREEHRTLLQSIAAWLRPGGLLVATMGTTSLEAGYEQNWLGAPMYWSHYDSTTNRQLVEQAGLHILNAREETADEDGVPVTFLWIVAQKPEV